MNILDTLFRQDNAQKAQFYYIQQLPVPKIA